MLSLASSVLSPQPVATTLETFSRSKFRLSKHDVKFSWRRWFGPRYRISLGLFVQHKSLMDELFQYKLHFYLGDLCNLTFTAGITLVGRRIYYTEICEGRIRRRTLTNSVKIKPVSRPPTRSHRRVKRHRPPSFWRKYRKKLPDAVFVGLTGGYVHAVSSYRILDKGELVIALFAVSGIVFKLIIQETARWYIIKKSVRSIHTMCVLVGVPTVLINTQTRIVLLGTQTNKLLVTGTFGMVLAEICLRAGKALYIMWTIRRRAIVFNLHLQQIPVENLHATSKTTGGASSTALRLEFELWRRQVLSYHTAEFTADMYAEYIAIGCSQSIMFWFADHPFYPALRLEAGSILSEMGITRCRINQVAMLGFQFGVEFLVDYVCVVMEMAVGIEFDRIKGLSTFLAVLFMAMVVLTINISATVYLG